ncbi:MAG TPA: NAD(P)/FAD-dependent oxidoreductase [Gaiellaceae bacterium]|nr:NAD(P)/FAD-dependent oxidoreductase [Gaiellaceae bacterium]
MNQQFDLIVLGSGSGARAGATKARKEFGARVAIVENTRWGGSCPNVACKPTKAYVVVADLAHDITTLAHKLGIEVGEATVNLARVKARKDELITPRHVWIERLRSAGHERFDGTGAFLDPTTVQVNGGRISAQRILVATGSRTAVPPIEGLDEVGWIDHVTALELAELPGSLLVVGGGPVGLELAQIFSRFGSRVTIVQHADRIAPRSDVTATDELHAALEEEGIEIRTGATVSRVRRQDGDVVATVGEDEIHAAQLLLASGRAPNVELLELGRVGIHHERAGITVDERLRTSLEGVWAAGDVTGIFPFTPVAQYQARIAVDDMFGGNGARADYSSLPTTIFTDPELSSVGLTERDAREQGHDVETAVHPIKYVQRAAYTDTKRGLYKLVCDRGSRRVLGIHVVCRNGGDIVQGFGVAMRLGATVDDLARAHHAFPTWAEGVKAAAEQVTAGRAAGQA